MKIGITFSAFDLLHAGHIKMLEDARRQCDYLICGLQTDPTIDRPEKNKPDQSVVERYIQLKACTFVDEVVPYATEQALEDILRSVAGGLRKVAGADTDVRPPRGADCRAAETRDGDDLRRAGAASCGDRREGVEEEDR